MRHGKVLRGFEMKLLPRLKFTRNDRLGRISPRLSVSENISHPNYPEKRKPSQTISRVFVDFGSMSGECIDYMWIAERLGREVLDVAAKTKVLEYQTKVLEYGTFRKLLLGRSCNLHHLQGWKVRFPN